jgi:intein-encoded DNA endonuclease-like protein
VSRPVPRTSTFPIYDRILGGRLELLLRRWREDGLSFYAIADRLADDYDIHVSHKTVGRWIADIDDTQPAA